MQRISIQDETGILDCYTRKAESFVSAINKRYQKEGKRYTQRLLLPGDKVLLIGMADTRGGKTVFRYEETKKVYTLMPSQTLNKYNRAKPLINSLICYTSVLGIIASLILLCHIEYSDGELQIILPFGNKGISPSVWIYTPFQIKKKQSSLASVNMGIIIAFVILGVIIVGIVSGGVAIYNRLVMLKYNVDKNFANIDVILKQRVDEIPNLIAVVKKTQGYEESLLNQLTELRTAFLSSRSTDEKVQLANEVGKLLNSFFAVSENYPELKAVESFPTPPTSGVGFGRYAFRPPRTLQ